MPTFTRTHTRYFDGDDIERLRATLTNMRGDFESRMPFMDKDTATAGRFRLVALEAAIALCDEPVVE